MCNRPVAHVSPKSAWPRWNAYPRGRAARGWTHEQRPRSRPDIGDSLIWRHAFVRKLLDRRHVLRQMRQSHAAQHIRRFGELNILVADDLYAVAPRVEKVEKRSGQRRDACIGQRFASDLLVIDDKSKMAPIVGGLCTASLECNELVSQIDEGHRIAFASKLKIEQATVERESRFDVTDLESDMIEPHHARFSCLGHEASNSLQASISIRRVDFAGDHIVERTNESVKS